MDRQQPSRLSGSSFSEVPLEHIVDHEGDVTLATAIPVGREVPISGYGHASWNPGVMMLPVGRGALRADGTKAWVEGHFFTDTSIGLDTY